MTFGYALIGLIIGFIIGVLVVRFGKTKLYSQQTLKASLENKNNELKEYHEELVNHFTRSAELLNSIVKDCYQLHKFMERSFHEFMSDVPIRSNPFKHHCFSESGNNQNPANLPPKDYSEGSSGLFCSIKEKKR